MNWDAIVAISEIVSAIAVVISLAYLSSQIRQSNKLARREARNDVIQTFTNTAASLTQVQGLPKVRSKLRSANCELSEEEYELADLYVGAIIGTYSTARSAMDEGFIPDGLAQSYCNLARNQIINFPGTAQIFYERLRSAGIKPGFSKIYDVLFEEIEKTRLEK